ncbi:MAG: hypothetical protein PHR35_15765, partial [Kiritimatiellae bacterium]|nr:hypothetical protein [Kiritimatiellia bacterium]
MKKQVRVLWQHGPVEGEIEVIHGVLAGLSVPGGHGKATGASFRLARTDGNGLEIAITQARVHAGAGATRVTVNTAKDTFTFFLRDVTRRFPVFIPAYGVAVAVASDKRSFEEIAADIAGRGLVSTHAAIENAPEETYEAACRRNRNVPCPVWLGVGRDMRIFRVSHQQSLINIGCSDDYGYWGYVQPCDHSMPTRKQEPGHPQAALEFAIGRGASCGIDIRSRLEEGCLPILRSEQMEDGVSYQLTAFATLERAPLGVGRVRGTDWRAAYAHTHGNMLTPEQRAALEPLILEETVRREEEVVCCLRFEAVNTASAPRYAWFKGCRMNAVKSNMYDARRGFCRVDDDAVCAVQRLNGRPMPQEEMAILLQPGETAVLEMLIPHRPITMARARRLAGMDTERHLEACRGFWRAKLASAARVHLPESAIDERLRAGLLHCDLVTLGRTASGPLLPTIGWYSPIGSESAPIIQFFDSMGWHKLAERTLDFFLERQREDGFIQNFGGYQLETGPALWTMGEHYRYTRDDAWVRRIRPRVLKACDYLLAWRNRNKRTELRDRGYGLLDGKVADPEDFYHSFMLNGVSYLGIARAAEMLARVAPADARRLVREAAAF